MQAPFKVEQKSTIVQLRIILKGQWTKIVPRTGDPTLLECTGGQNYSSILIHR